MSVVGELEGVSYVDEIPAASVAIQQLWIPVVYAESNLTFAINSPDDLFQTEQALVVKPYTKNYFDGGTFNILHTNHNDLGWLNTQAITADYR